MLRAKEKLNCNERTGKGQSTGAPVGEQLTLWLAGPEKKRGHENGKLKKGARTDQLQYPICRRYQRGKHRKDALPRHTTVNRTEQMLIEGVTEKKLKEIGGA